MTYEVNQGNEFWKMKIIVILQLCQNQKSKTNNDQKMFAFCWLCFPKFHDNESRTNLFNFSFLIRNNQYYIEAHWCVKDKHIDGVL